MCRCEASWRLSRSKLVLRRASCENRLCGNKLISRQHDGFGCLPLANTRVYADTSCLPLNPGASICKLPYATLSPRFDSREFGDGYRFSHV